MSIVVMVVLGIVVMAYLWIGQSSQKMLHHIYYQEKVLAIFEGLDVIARGVVQSEGTLKSLLDNEQGKAVDITQQVVDRMDRFGLLGEGEGGGQLAKKFKDYLKVEASLKNLEKMPDFASIKAAEPKDAKLPKALAAVGSPEVMGRVAIRIQLTDSIQLQTHKRDGKDESAFLIPKRDVSMEYEFKRARVVPPFFRHFSLWVKNGIPETELPERYDEKGNYNWSQNHLDGKDAQGVLFIKSGDGYPFGPQSDFQGASLAGQFANKIGYIYLGGKNKCHLNLMAGDIDKQAIGSETFHLYRGATTDFYKVWSTEFSNFIEKSEVQQPGVDAPANPNKGNFFQRAWEKMVQIGKNAIEWLKGAVKRALELDSLEQGNKNAQMSNALPLYYVVRKDYGYAIEWGNPSYQRFGFAQGGDDKAQQTIVSSSLHLYGANTDGGAFGIKEPGTDKPVAGELASPTCVLGNVYRRCLSLSGYKQRRNGDGKSTSVEPSSDRKFEVQAGPIEYFRDYDDLVKRTQDPTQEKEKKPIWVWDARVKWNMDPNAPSGSEGNGTYLPISGAGLFGRIIPGLAKLWEGDKAQKAVELFNASVAPPKETQNATEQLLKLSPQSGINVAHTADIDISNAMFTVGLSPVFQILGQTGFFTKAEYKPGDGYLFNGTTTDSLVTPYFEELLRCFCFTVSGLGSPDKAIETIRQEAAKQNQPALSKDMEDAMLAALKGGRQRWTDLMDNKDNIRDKVFVKELKPDQIKDEKMRKYWSGESASSAPAAGGPPAPTFFPFCLPDPWDKTDKPRSSANRNFRETFEKWVTSWPVDKTRSPGEFFKAYFTPLMTNPARVLPYNYSLRFMCSDLREIFSLPFAERKKLLMETFPAEVTDGIGYIEKGENDYLDPANYPTSGNEAPVGDMPLNDPVLQKIHELRVESKDKKRLQNASYFMDEYGSGVNVPSGPNTPDVFFERSFWQTKGGEGSSGGGSSEGVMTWSEAQRRFLVPQAGGKSLLYLNTMLGMAQDKIELGKEGPVEIHGSGAIIVDGSGEITILNDIIASKPVFLVADKITIAGNCKAVQAGLIAHTTISLAGASTDPLYIYGNVVCGTWDKSSFTRTGRRLIAYNSEFKNLDQFITNIEPRIRKFSSADN
ncbi:MAG: hypothetical protein HY303_19395 [Candidatus Wallbacteria bacterium]|nr:hypothetical protein [Candidatus Wallbacteria bacterium]